MSGYYYVIGGTKNIQVFKSLVYKLVGRIDPQFPRILYVGFSGEADYRDIFHSNLTQAFPKSSFSSVVLGSSMGRADLSSARDLILRSNFIYVAGGQPKNLINIIRNLELVSAFQDAVAQGAAVGGLCAGGTMHAARYIAYHDDAEAIESDEGFSSIPDVALTVKIDYERGKEQRIAGLQKLLHMRAVSRAYAVGSNAALTFSAGGVRVVCGNQNGQCNAFQVEGNSFSRLDC